MKASRIFFRTLFLSLCLLFLGVVHGAAFGLLLLVTEQVVKQIRIKALALATIGLGLGYLLGTGLIQLGRAIGQESFDTYLMLIGCFVGVMVGLRSAEELQFVRTTTKSKDILLSPASLADPRLFDLASTGLLDGRLVLPKFVVDEVRAKAEEGNAEAKKSLQVLDQITPYIRLSKADVPGATSTKGKLLALARRTNADLLTVETTAATDDVRSISINALSKALRPLSSIGESLTLKIQRSGKEPNQGVGYLEDGTMVVVNGGGASVGHNVVGQVLSVKHTPSGRIIFCNAVEE